MASSQNSGNSLRMQTEESEDTQQDQAVNLETNSTTNTTDISGASPMGQNLANGSSPRRGILFIQAVVHEDSIIVLLQLVPAESLYPPRPTYNIPTAIQRTYSMADRLQLLSRIQSQFLRIRRIRFTMNNFEESDDEGEDGARPAGQTAANTQGPQVQESPDGNNRT